MLRCTPLTSRRVVAAIGPVEKAAVGMDVNGGGVAYFGRPSGSVEMVWMVASVPASAS